INGETINSKLINAIPAEAICGKKAEPTLDSVICWKPNVEMNKVTEMIKIKIPENMSIFLLESMISPFDCLLFYFDFNSSYKSDGYNSSALSNISFISS